MISLSKYPICGAVQLAALCFVLAVLQATQACGADPGAAPPRTVVSVPILTPDRTNLARTTTQPATIHAYYNASILAKTSGYLTQLKADIGQPVKAGEVLAVIDVPELAKQREAKLADIKKLEAEEKRAVAELAVAKANAESYAAKVELARAESAAADAETTAARVELDRVTDLVKQRAVADRMLDEATKKHESAQAGKTAAESAVSAAVAEVALARAQGEAAQAQVEVAGATTDVARRELEELEELLKFAQLKAPFDGVVTQRHVELGDLIRNTQAGSNQPGPPLFVVARLDTVRVRVAVPERDAPLVDVGDAARITLQALGSRNLAGQVARIAGVLDERTRTMLVEIDLPNEDGLLLPGMFGQATITLEPVTEKVVMPAEAVRYDEAGKSYVYVVNASNQIEVVDVITGWDTGQRIEITSGLNGDERVVGPILGRLRAGQSVRVE